MLPAMRLQRVGHDFAMTLWTVAHQVPLFMEFSRQKCWSGLPFPSPGDLSNPGIKPKSPTLQADSLPAEPPGQSERVITKAKGSWFPRGVVSA